MTGPGEPAAGVPAVPAGVPAAPQAVTDAARSAQPPRPGFWRRPVGRVLKWSGLFAFLLAAGVAGYLYCCGVLGDNFHRVEAGGRPLYRSAQLSAGTLEAQVKAHGIQSVLNLRGENTGKPWYDAETEALQRLGVRRVNIKLSGRKAPSRENLVLLIRSLKTLPRPLLVHCESGADRTGLACALERLIVQNNDFAAARAELVFWPYGHTGWGGYAAMDRVLDQFELYRRNGGTLDVEGWAAEVYVPDSAPAGPAESAGE